MTRPKPWLILILSVYFAIAFAYARFTPAWQAPDEPAHYNTVQFIALHGRLPVLADNCYDQAYLDVLRDHKFTPELSISSICYEHYQPPLYYILAAPVYLFSNGQLLALRLFSALLGGLSLLAIYGAVRLFWPDPVLAGATTAFAAFIPMHLTMLASVNNDSLAELLYAGLIYLLLRWLLKGQSQKILVAAGGVLGLILVTKVTVYISILVVGVTLLLARRTPRRLALNGLTVYGPALLLALPLYLRNAQVYGGLDVLGLARHDQVVVGQLRTVDYLADIGLPAYVNNLTQTTFHSFWGQFGWMAVPMDGRVYTVLGLVSLAALVGLGLWLWRQFPTETATRQGLAVMATALVFSSAGFVALNLSFVQFQGRYFFNGLLPLGVFFNLGLLTALQKRYAFWTAGALIGGTLVAVWRDGLNKWTAVLGGGLTALAIGRRWLPDSLTPWLVAGFYVALAGLALTSVWWFIVPNL